MLTLTQLTTLNLNGNQLTALSPDIGVFAHMEDLYLSSNKLVMLPPEIGTLTQLRALNLSHNQLTALPPEIGLLNDLRELYVRDNQLTELPATLAGKPSLFAIEVVQNDDLTFPPLEASGYQPSDVAAFMRRPPTLGPWGVDGDLVWVVVGWVGSLWAVGRGLRWRIKR
ncbi:MAG: leucine-rich repeat domain-containing protein [Chloroflexota bacterium]